MTHISARCVGGVAAAVIGSAACAGVIGLFYRGMPHTALGGAAISLDLQGNLVISNIGSSGLDGVSVDLGLAESFLKREQTEKASEVLATVHGEIGGLARGLLLSLEKKSETSQEFED